MGNTPKLRFKGYSGDWGRHKLGDVFTQTSNYVNPKEDGIALWSLTVEDGLTPKTERYVREFLVKKDDKFKEVRPGDIVYNPMNMTLGAVGYNGMDRSVAVSGYYTTMVAGEDYDAYFINTWLKSPQAILLYKAYATGTLLEKQRVQFPTLSIIPAVFPSRDEQADIGTLFESIDKLIALYQHKYEMLTRAKHFYLQNMIPQNGETAPRIRFDGFTDMWEQRRLCDLVQFSKGAGYSKGDLKESGTPIILYGRLYTKYGTVITEVDTFADAKPGSVYSHGGEVIVPASGESAEDISVASVVEKSGILLGGDLNIIVPPVGLDSTFLAISISSGKPHKDMAKMAQGKSIVHLHNTDLEKINLPYPSYEEQAQISGFFSNLDHLITLHQRKASVLQTMKLFLLQNMFV